MADSPPSPARVVVCLKLAQITSVRLRLDAQARGARDGDAPMAANPADLSALAWALSLKAEGAVAEVTALSVGPGTWDDLLRLTLASGADRVLRVWNPRWPEERWLGVMDGSAGHTRFAAEAAAEAMAPLRPALVLTGESSADGAHGCFGAFLARRLEAAYAHRVVALHAETGGWRVRVKLERGYAQEILMYAPLVLTVQAASRRLAEPGLPAWIGARSASIPVRGSSLDYPALPATALRPPVPRVKRFAVPDSSQNAEARILAMIQQPRGQAGTLLPSERGSAAQAEAVLALLKEKGFCSDA
jgi:electron transfer flavoprotein alpha/beta subunit